VHPTEGVIKFPKEETLITEIGSLIERPNIRNDVV
jgi:hypothetical protein